jgi:uncharacterized SAM-binding protein YcdF (DUF218 family)
MWRAVFIFQRVGVNVIPYPVDFRFDGQYNFFSFLPKFGVLKDSSLALREYLGNLFYRIVY